jgi:hypothetical protein
LVCQNCRLSTKREKSLYCRAHFDDSAILIFSIDFLWSVLFPQVTGVKVTTHRVEDIGTMGCPEGIVSDTAVTISVPRSLRHDASHLCFRGTEPSLPS